MISVASSFSVLYRPDLLKSSSSFLTSSVEVRLLFNEKASSMVKLLSLNLIKNCPMMVDMACRPLFRLLQNSETLISFLSSSLSWKNLEV